MGMPFNADEIFEMAIEIEQNGAAFYRKAAALQADEATVRFLDGLAAMEDDHERTFMRMRDTTRERGAQAAPFDPTGEAERYLDSLADAHGGEGSASAADNLTGNDSLEDILGVAIDLEKKSILFYTGLENAVPAESDRDEVRRIIDEEQKHVSALECERRKARASSSA